MNIGTSPRSMSVRAWARSRRIPSSTAAKAARDGCISRDARGRVRPEQADREWMERTRPRIDGRVPRPPAPPEVAALLPDEGDPQGWVRLCELFPVLSWSDALLAAPLGRMADALAPTLVGKTEDEIRAALHRGLDRAVTETLAAQDDDKAALATLDAAIVESRRRADLLLERGGSGLL